jgi:thioredoxin reductase
LEKNSSCGSFFEKLPHSKNLISLNKKYTGETNKDFNLRHDWNSLLNDEQFLFTNFSDDLYPSSDDLYKYINEFAKYFELKILYNSNVKKVIKTDNYYKLLINDDICYTCSKLIIATGLSIPNYPENIFHPKEVKHYNDYKNNYFKDKENLKNYINKRVLIFGGGNSSYELANILEKYCSTVLILGSNKNLALVSHYVGDIRSVNLPFLDTFYLKSLNGIDIYQKENKICIKKVTLNDKNVYKIVDLLNNDYYHSERLSYFDEIIFCTGWKFDNTIFDFDVKTTINNKYPEIKENYESSNNNNLYFIGSLMHSRDYKKGSGGFINGFRYLLKLFTQLNYNIDTDIINFNFTGDMSCYNELTKHIFSRINYASSIYQLYGVMCDIFYYDKNTKNIIYIQDFKQDCLHYLKIDSPYVNFLYLEYGPQETIIQKLGSFNKWNPSFLHPKI